MKTKVYIMVGPPGSGKTTKKWEIVKSESYKMSVGSHFLTVCSADSFFERNDERIYKYDPNKLEEAHGGCLKLFVSVVQHSGSSEQTDVVIVDNCNVSKETIAPYIAVASAYGCEIHILKFSFVPAEELFKRNVHNVPLKSIQGMQRSMEHMFKTWPSYWPKPEEVK